MKKKFFAFLGILLILSVIILFPDGKLTIVSVLYLTLILTYFPLVEILLDKPRSSFFYIIRFVLFIFVFTFLAILISWQIVELFLEFIGKRHP